MKPSAQTYFESASPIGLDIGSRGRQPQLDVQGRAARAIVLAMNRRTFIHVAGASGLSLASPFGFGATERAVEDLVDLLVDSPRERIPRELVRLIEKDLRYEDLLAALALAAVHNVQPYPRSDTNIIRS